MKKNIFVVLFLMLALLFLTACQNEALQDLPEESPSSVSIVDENPVTPADIIYSDPALTKEEKMMIEWNVHVFLDNFNIKEEKAHQNAKKMNSVGIKRITKFVIEKEDEVWIDARIVDETNSVYFLTLINGKGKDIYFIADSDGKSLFAIRR